jgi:hypothetical protein
MRKNNIRPSFVEYIPDQLEEGILYISERFRTCSHKCCCGCGEEVVTPLSPAEWRLTKEGSSVSLWPSIGNWNYACRSHYFISRNQIKWAAPMSSKQIARVQQRDSVDLARMVNRKNQAKALPPDGPVIPSAVNRNERPPQSPGFLTAFIQWLFGK